METLKLGSKGQEVKNLQRILGIKADGDFGPITKKHVIRFQLGAGLPTDGIVGNDTWTLLLARGPEREAIDEGTDLMEQHFTTPYNQIIHRHFLPKGEYIEGPITNDYIFYTIQLDGTIRTEQLIIGVEINVGVLLRNLY